ncbi:hypothetical protein D1646_06135 [Pseudoflavonifractor sp. 60]|uniref:hypothetical protein n=1 Tax=Pseudoflavonifractor sp. 60 TaxID=2304576 RepID=UPI00136DBBE2|nr:hypothetical protein [Pseudoflavonifractor sp. 60]NBI66396.1 hypothetical protein [Pseudoflavonifractor sp. 60]
MMEKRGEYWTTWMILMKEVEKMLPDRAQRAIWWAAANYDGLTEMCDDPAIALEDIPTMMEKAWKEESYALFMLLCISKALKKSKENEEI